MFYDIFNGDADGIIALLQLRMANPVDSELITGVKRDIQLVQAVKAVQGDTLTILDISMEKNITGLNSALAQGASVFYADHHRSGDIPVHPSLDAHIDLDANTCTSLIIDKYLAGRYHDWAIAGAYGDNMLAKAEALAEQAGFSVEQREQLKEIGTLINYNGYGSSVNDLHFDPANLYRLLLSYPSPFDLITDLGSPFYKLQQAYQTDMHNAVSIQATHKSDCFALFELPNEAWSRRISGVYGNLLANQAPNAAHAVLTLNSDGSYLVSLRAPLNNKQGAGELCAQFATGGGRAAAAGINNLPKEMLATFIKQVESTYCV